MQPDLRARFEHALAGFPSEPALVRLVRELTREGFSQRQVYDAFDAMREAMRAEGRDFDEDAIMLVMDRIVGYCGEDARLFPEQMTT